MLGGCHNSLGSCHKSLGEYLEAIRQHKHACAIAEEMGDLPGQRNALNNLGDCYRLLMQLEQAIGVLKQAQTMTGVGTRTSQSVLACCYMSLGQFHRAIGIHEEDRVIMEEVGNRAGVGMALNNLGCCRIKLKQFNSVLEPESFRKMSVTWTLLGLPSVTLGPATGSSRNSKRRLNFTIRVG